MALDFIVKDVIHKVMAKFVHAFLPDAKKPYNLKPRNANKLRMIGRRLHRL